MKNKKTAIISLMAMAMTCAVSAVTVMNAKIANAAGEGEFHELGASIRVASDKGIRFAFGLPEDKTGADYAIGTLIIPKVVLGDAELNHNDDTADDVDVIYEEIKCNKNWVPNGELIDAIDGYKYFNAALTEIPTVEYNTVLVARSYYVKDGVYTYSDPVERSIGYVASAALNDGYNDTNGILSGIIETGYGETALTISAEKDLIEVGETLEFTASNDKGYLPVWSSSNTDVATVDKTGKVTLKKGGEATITATIGNVTAEKTIYSVGAGLYADDIGMRVNGYNMTNNASYMSMNIGENGEMIIGAKFQASWENYYAGLIWRNIESKEYYQALVDNGYKYITFDLKVDGKDKDKVSDLYVFCGQQLTSFEQVNGVYKVKMLVSDIVRVYDRVQTFLPGDTDRIGQIGSAAGMLLAWRDNRGTDRGMERNYVFTISNPKFTIPTLAVDFAEGSADLVEAGKTTTLLAQTNLGGEVVWESSDESVATVENGVVTGLKSGIVTVSATFCGLTVEKTVYVVGGLNSNQIGIRVNGTDVSSNQNYFKMAVDASGKMSITANMTADATYYPALTLKNMFDKAYYQKLIANGYTKLTFMLGVGGTNATDVSDLYVLGSKKLTSFPKNANGEYAVTVSVDTIVNYYDTMYTIATSSNKVGQTSSMSAKFITWQSPAGDYSTVRNYVFTISNIGFRQGVLFSDNIGMRVNGYNMTKNTSYMTMDIGANGEMIIEAKFQASWENYYAGLVFDNIGSQEYYQKLVDNGYKYLTFDLKVEGTDADKVDDLYVFCGQKLSSIAKVDGVYKVQILVSDFVRVYDRVATFVPSDQRIGQIGSAAGMFLAWRDNRGSDRGTSRNYIFTISNTAYSK